MNEELKKELTTTKVSAAARTMQAIEANAEDFYIKQIKGSEEQPSENLVAESVEEMTALLPLEVITHAGHGYRTSVTLMANMLTQIGQDELAAAVLKGIIDETE